MEKLDSGQQKTRDRFESAISLMSPVLNLVLNVGERISRAADPIDHEYYPIRGADPDEELSEDTGPRQ